MSAVRTIEFLPKFFKTSANSKFLAATLDQLVSEPNLVRLNGYIGRKNVVNARRTDNYIPELSDFRSDYQLEPCVVGKDIEGNNNFVSSYQDLLNKLDYLGSDITDQSRLFAGEYYSYSGLIDFDKLVNFSQYYWLPDGPDAVNIFGTNVLETNDFNVTANDTENGYYIAGSGAVANPVILLARGGTYSFNLDDTSRKFYIQTEPGIDGFRSAQRNISSRDVLGVTGNGTTEVKFQVPLKSAQDFYLSMEKVADVDLVTTLKYRDLQGELYSDVVAKFGGIDGQKSLAGKRLIFLNDGFDFDEYWDTGGIFDRVEGFDANGYDFSVPIDKEFRFGVWQFNNDETPGAIINLQFVGSVDTNEKVRILEGRTYGNKEFFKNTRGFFQEIPLITAIQDILYYQDSENPLIFGEIRLVEPGIAVPIDIEKDVLGKKTYTSPNGVVFTNGLKVRFDTTAIPSSYVDREYYVEGVGSAIRLVDTSLLASAIDSSLSFNAGESYIVSNRSSKDLSPWARGNRWFHQDVVTATSRYNNTVTIIDQSARAKRPIIEFEPDLEMFNFAKLGKATVDLLDISQTDAFSNVEGQNSYQIDGVDLDDGMRVVFAADTEPGVRNNIYEVSIIDVDGNGNTQIHLTVAEDGVPEIYDGIQVLRGETYRGYCFWFNGDSWVESQQRIGLSTPPLFNIYDSEGVSLSNSDKYPATNFVGTKVFSYKQGTGVADTVLRFPLTYRNFNNVGDIVFENNYVVDTFNYTSSDSTISSPVSIGYVHKTLTRFTYEKKNTWEKVVETSKQYQIFSFDYSGTNKFVTGILPTPLANIPAAKVYINNKILTASEFRFIVENTVPKLEILKDLVDGDKVDLYLYSKDVSSLAHYQVPSNLDNNSVNENFETITLGQMRNHVEQVFANSLDQTGSFPGASNLRDIAVKDNPGKILQHSAPLTYASLFLTHPTADFVKSLDNARREYTRFKNKFMEAAYNLNDVSVDDPVVAVDQILAYLNSYKTADMPWFRSDMVPYGSNNTVITYTVEDSDRVGYEISTIFKDTAPRNQALLVYVDGVQLVKFRDYNISTDRPAILFDTDYRPAVGSVISIIEYADTDGSWIPETPTKMGMYPAFIPEIVNDDTYRQPVDVIVGHDGSRTVVFNDFRDAILLELEKRIYNNIKVRYNPSRLDINTFLPGKFRKNDYQLANVNRLLSTFFLKWVGANRLSYTENTYYDNNDGFTWSYRKFVDKLDGEPLPGYWRGIFRYFYDTERPNITPWEMLGFSERPSWWVSRYGPAPYTSGNLVLWRDLEAGRILEGERSGIDPNYARPGLTQVIPVNEYGELISPHEFIVKEYTPYNTNLSFVVGDDGPVETAWRNSSEFPYAVQYTIALLNPAQFFGIQLDTSNYLRDSDTEQYLYLTTGQRPTRDMIYAHGEVLENGNIIRTSGYLNWIADYNRTLGLGVEESLGALIRNFDVQLGYKVAGFTDKKMLKVFAEQASPTSTNSSILIPDEDYDILLSKSVPVSLLKYSAVIVRKTNAGWSVEGYDLENPFFTIIPPDANSRRQEQNIAGITYTKYERYLDELTIIPYGYEFFSRQQVVEFLLGYERFLLDSGFKFDQLSKPLNEVQNWSLSVKEFINWSAQGWGVDNLLVLSPAYNFLQFEVENAVLDSINDPASNTKLIDVNFRPYNVKDVSVTRTDGRTEIEILTSTIGFADLTMVQYEHVAIFNNTTVFNDVIYQPSLGNRQNRLKLVGHKTGDWNGSLYAPGYILNQDNIPDWQPGQDYKKADLVRYKSKLYVAIGNIPASSEFSYTDWKLSDFSKIKTGLLPNFATKAKQIGDGYDLENINLESDIDTLSKGLIGFRPRSYLSDIGVEDTSQVKFYQGFIREKGTRSSIESFTSARIDRLSSEIELYEDWALRVGEYGATDSTQSIEIVLPEAQFSKSPAFLSLINEGDLRPVDRVGIKPSELYKKPKDYDRDLFMTRPAGRNYNLEINSAGPVRLDDIDYTVFDIANISSLNTELDNIGTGTHIWVAKDDLSVWNVYRVDQSNTIVTKVINAVDNYLFIETREAHGLAVGMHVILKNVSDVFDGFHRIDVVPSENTLLVPFDTTRLAGFEAALDLQGYLLDLVSVKVVQASDATDIEITSGWKDGDRFWVDNDSDLSPWRVYKKTSPWSESFAFEDSDFTGDNYLGKVVSMSADGNVIATTCNDPTQGTTDGLVKIWVKDGDNYTDQVAIYNASGTLLPYGIRRGAAGGKPVNDMTVVVSSTGDFIIEAYDKALLNRGSAAVYVRREDPNEYQQVASIGAADGFASTDAFEFGDAVALSKDDSWLFIGAPGVGDETPNVGRVYALARNTLNGKTYFYHLDNAASIIPTDLQVGDRFGDAISVSTDGAQVVISAPKHDNGDGTTGVVYVYDRIIEAFLVAVENTTVFTTKRDMLVPLDQNLVNPVAKPRVTVDLVEVDQDDYEVDYGNKTITFNTAPKVGSVVRIEVNEFALIQRLAGSNQFEGLEYGTSVAMCYNNCSIYVGSPNVDSETNIDRDTGLVYRYINQGRVYGVITGEKVNPTVKVGDSIRIDDFEITFTGTSLASVINNINSAGIPGITASNVGGKLHIVEDSKLTFAKLRVLPGVGTALEDLGLRVFVEIQQIRNPVPTERGYFGASLAINQNSNVLVVGAPKADFVSAVSIDNGQTVFDDTSTTFSSRSKRSGAVYVFEQLPSTESSVANPSQYILAQKLTGSIQVNEDELYNEFISAGGAVSDFDDWLADFVANGLNEVEYGTSIAIGGNQVLVSAPGSSRITGNSIVSRTGALALITDNVGAGAWIVDREEGEYVDVGAINSVFIYNKVTGKKVEVLDIIDPAKGKVLGLAGQELDFISDNDPAYYNIGDTTKVQERLAWGPERVGTVWWDTSVVRYMDYEQGEFTNRSNNWGKMFPGSEIRIYQWVESPVPPSRYSVFTTNGFPRNPNDVEFVEKQTIDKYTGAPVTRYYYWVENLTTVYRERKRMSIMEVAELIRDPQNSGTAFAAFLSSSTIGLWNVGDQIVDRDMILHVDYDVVKNDNIIHSEFQLVQENRDDSEIPVKIERKIVDSLCGRDAAGNVVPDPSLNEAEKLGISFRPRQSMFKDQKGALKVFVDRINAEMLKTPVVETYGLNPDWFAQESIPDAVDGGYSDIVPDITSLGYLDIENQFIAGEKVLVEYDSGVRGWAIYVKETVSSTTWTLHRAQSYNTQKYWETIDWYKEGFNANNIKIDVAVQTDYQVSALRTSPGQIIRVNNAGGGKFKLYQVQEDGALETIGLQKATVRILDTVWQEQPGQETRFLLSAVKATYTGTLVMNQLLFVLIRYALSEQQYIDWAFKTSFITILHKIRELEQFPTYQRDNQDYIEEFINEVKPYRTKIREYLLSYSAIDTWNESVTDFDLPGYYDVDFERFRSPSGEKNKDPELWELPQNADWLANHTMSVDTITVFNGGSGYTIRPQVEIVGGGGSGATAVAQILGGQVVAINVTNPGSGYLTTPTVVISGGNGTGAIAAVRASNATTRKIKTTIKFDRISYETKVTDWTANVSYQEGDIVRYGTEVYRVVTPFVSTSLFGKTNLEVYADELFDNANDRTMAYYEPQGMMPNRVLSQIFAGIDYPGVRVTGRNFSELEPTEYGEDGSLILAASQFDTIIRSEFKDEALGTRPEDINIVGGAFVDTFSSHAPEELIPGIIFDALDFKVFTIPTLFREAEGLGPDIVMHAFNGDGSTSTFNVEVVGKSLDNIIVYGRNSGNYQEDVDFVYDRSARTVTFTTPPINNDLIYVYVLGDVSLNEIFDSRIYGDGSTTGFTFPTVEFSLLSGSYVVVDGKRVTDYQMVASDDATPKARIVFDTAPTEDQYIRVHLFTGDPSVQQYSEFYDQHLTVGAEPSYPASYTIQLDRPLRYAGPFTGNIIIDVNSQRLRPSTSNYFTGDESTLTYAIPTTTDVLPDALVIDDVEVYVDGELQTRGVDYTIPAYDGSSSRVVEFTAPVVAGSEIVVTLTTGMEFDVLDESTIRIRNTVTLAEGDKVRILTFSNHNPLKIHTQVFLGTSSEEVASTSYFDAEPYDSLRYDAADNVIINRPTYTLSRPVTNINYVWLTVNGTRQLSNVDFFLQDSTTIAFPPSRRISQTDVIVITTFTENVYSQALGFRIFKDMLGEVSYLRISQENSSRLAQDLLITDTVIHVEDARLFPAPGVVNGTPGVVFIEGERITYFEIDYANNTLGRLRRGSAGTGAANFYRAGTLIVSGGKDQEIPFSKDTDAVYTSVSDGSTLTYTFEDLTLYSPPVDGSSIPVAETSDFVQVYIGGVMLDKSAYTVDSTDPVVITLNEPVELGREVSVVAKFGRFWYDMTDTSLSLSASNTAQAIFLKEKTSYIPG